MAPGRKRAILDDANADDGGALDSVGTLASGPAGGGGLREKARPRKAAPRGPAEGPPVGGGVDQQERDSGNIPQRGPGGAPRAAGGSKASSAGGNALPTPEQIEEFSASGDAQLGKLSDDDKRKYVASIAAVQEQCDELGDVLVLDPGCAPALRLPCAGWNQPVGSMGADASAVSC